MGRTPGRLAPPTPWRNNQVSNQRLDVRTRVSIAVSSIVFGLVGLWLILNVGSLPWSLGGELCCAWAIGGLIVVGRGVLREAPRDRWRRGMKTAGYACRVLESSAYGTATL